MKTRIHPTLPLVVFYYENDNLYEVRRKLIEWEWRGICRVAEEWQLEALWFVEAKKEESWLKWAIKEIRESIERKERKSDTDNGRIDDAWKEYREKSDLAYHGKKKSIFKEAILSNIPPR